MARCGIVLKEEAVGLSRQRHGLKEQIWWQLVNQDSGYWILVEGLVPLTDTLSPKGSWRHLKRFQNTREWKRRERREARSPCVRVL